ncbi:hypothetical protein CEXT_262861 [Caerostris extrusa]|uniref:Uncharacterized protein n=1 Tax=Caerostris extrusa TaxID=172846 RepID=A0AAV4Q519_CAEEX|nr:hypothetical protein CEXT_262861 [Caerostris extrusa]
MLEVILLHVFPGRLIGPIRGPEPCISQSSLIRKRPYMARTCHRVRCIPRTETVNPYPFPRGTPEVHTLNTRLGGGGPSISSCKISTRASTMQVVRENRLLFSPVPYPITIVRKGGRGGNAEHL